MNNNVNLLKKMYDLCSKESYTKIKEGKQYSEEDLHNMHNICKTSSYLIINTQKNLTPDFCAKILASNVDTNGKTNLLKYLNDLCNNINDTLGNVNKLQAIYDAEENTLKIIDDNILKRVDIIEPKVAVFKSFGVNIVASI